MAWQRLQGRRSEHSGFSAPELALPLALRPGTKQLKPVFITQADPQGPGPMDMQPAHLNWQ